MSTEDRARYCFEDEWNLGKEFFSDGLPFDWEINFYNNFNFIGHSALHVSLPHAPRWAKCPSSRHGA